MPTVHVLTGLPASGKSTAALKLVADSGGRIRRVNLDSLRLMLDDNDGSVRNTREHEEVVTAVQDAAIVAAVDAGFDCVIDNTHLVPRLPNRYRRLLATRDVTFEVHDFTDVPVKECVRRDALRAGSVGEEVIRAMAERMRSARRSGWRLTAEWMNDGRVTVAPYIPDWTLPTAVLCDLDGTLAIHNGRGPYEIDKCETDLVNRPVADSLLVHARGDRIILLSGRQSEYREHAAVSWPPTASATTNCGCAPRATAAVTTSSSTSCSTPTSGTGSPSGMCGTTGIA